HAVEAAPVLISGEEAREYGVAIEVRIAPPHQAAEGIDQRSHPAVADQSEFETAVPVRLRHGVSLPSAARTAAGLSKIALAPGSSRPTASPSPPCAGIAAIAGSSVTSSPTNTGRRPAKGGCASRRAMAVALFQLAPTTSYTILPGSSRKPSWPGAASR